VYVPAVLTTMSKLLLPPVLQMTQLLARGKLLSVREDQLSASLRDSFSCVTTVVVTGVVQMMHPNSCPVLCVQCVVKDDPATGKRVVAGTHWDFDSYGGTIKKQLGMPTQVPQACIS